MAIAHSYFQAVTQELPPMGQGSTLHTVYKWQYSKPHDSAESARSDALFWSQQHDVHRAGYFEWAGGQWVWRSV